MAPNHQVTLGHELPESSAAASASQQDTDDVSKTPQVTPEVTSQTEPIASCSADSADQVTPYLPLKWLNIVSIGLFHMVATYGFWVGLSQGMWRTLLWSKYIY